MHSLDGVEHQFKARVAVHVNVQLPAGVPVNLGERAKSVGVHHPFAVMVRVGSARVVEVRLLHLHQLTDDGAVGEEFHLLGQQPYLAVACAGDLRLGVGHRVGRVHAGVGLAAGVDEKCRQERRASAPRMC